MPATKYYAGRGDELIKFMGQGYSKSASAAKMGVHRHSIDNWAEKHEEFAEALALAESKRDLWWEQKGRDAVEGKIENFNVTAFIWMTKNVCRWSDKLEHTGKGGGPVSVNVNLKQ